MKQWRLIRMEVSYIPRLWLAVGLMDGSLMLVLAGIALKVGRR